MKLPVVAIVGRPNVGKSSLLNCLVGKRISIVAPRPGVTRDRVSVCCPLGHGESPKYVELVDTGGMGIEDVDDLTDHVEAQIDCAIADAALILFVVDAREGICALDRHAAEKLRKQNKPVILVANKVDELKLPTEAGEFHALGFGEPMVISATHNLGIADLLEAVEGRLPGPGGNEPAAAAMKLAVVGKRNAGKSTFINTLAGEQRVIVSQKPGTTRDSVDVTVQLGKKTFVLIDTAGLRRKKSLDDDVAFYSQHRAMRAIRRADVVALLIDASVPVSQVDKNLAGIIAELFKPVVLVVNKWDLAAGKAVGKDYQTYLTKTLPGLSYAPISLTTATQGLNVRQTVDLAEQLFRQANTRVPTARVNEVIQEILEMRGPSHKPGTHRPKILYASQVAVGPPTIVCFVNDPRSFDDHYQRFLLNQLHQRLPFNEVPIRLIFRQRRPGRKKDQ